MTPVYTASQQVTSCQTSSDRNLPLQNCTIRERLKIAATQQNANQLATIVGITCMAPRLFPRARMESDPDGMKDTELKYSLSPLPAGISHSSVMDPVAAFHR